MNPQTTARLAGMAGIAYLATSSIGLGGPFFDNPSRSTILTWVRQHHDALVVQGVQLAFGLLLVAAVIAQLLRRAGKFDGIARLAVIAIIAAIAVDQVSAVVNFTLAELGRNGNDAGVLTMFSLAKNMTFVDGLLFGIAVLSASVVSIRQASLPSPIAWLGVVVGALHVLSLPLQVALTRTPDGVVGPLSVFAALAWILAVSLLLLIRPAAALPEPVGAVA